MYRRLRAEAAEVLAAALSAHDLPADELGLEDPPGDVDAIVASSVAFRLTEAMGATPPEVAARLAEAVDASECTYVADVQPVGPYLNVLPSDAYYRDTLAAGLDVAYGRLPDTGERVVVEHTSANPTGPVHVGRARNPIIGDAIARILDAAGHDVERHYYVNDAGRQVAVFTWAHETIDEASLPAPTRDKPDYQLVRFYRAGNRRLEELEGAEHEAAEAEIQAIMQGLEAGDEATLERVHAVVDEVLAGMRATLERLPARFDEFVKETRFLVDGSTAEIADRLCELPAAVQEDEAWRLDLEDHGIDTPLVFLRSDGTSLYTTRDLAHHEWKLDRFDRAVTVLGEDHKLQARQLLAALEQLGPDVERIRTVHYSWVNLPGGEGMSTRQGTGVDLDDLLDEAVERAREEVESRIDTRIRDADLDEEDVDRIARQVGVGAVRYDIVAKQPTKAITFEWERALDFDAQSAPHLQYVHARCCGIIEQADDEVPAEPDATVLDHPAERALIEVIARFPAEIETAADELAPQSMATYTRTFAERFNAFYRDCPVTAEDVPADRRAARLALVVSARHTIANALDLLGIEAPESM